MTSQRLMTASEAALHEAKMRPIREAYNQTHSHEQEFMNSLPADMQTRFANVLGVEAPGSRPAVGQPQRQVGQFGMPANPIATATTQSPAFDAEAFDSFMGGLDDSQRNMIHQYFGMQQQQAQQQMQQQMQQHMQMGGMSMMGGIMGMAPPQMRGYMPMMQSPMMYGGYMPQQMGMMGGYGGQMMGGYGYGNPMMGGMMGVAPPMMRQMAVMPQQAMMYGGYPQQQMYGQQPMQQQMYGQQQQMYGQQPQMQQSNYGGQSAQPNMQQAAYAQPQMASPFGGAMRGYYA